MELKENILGSLNFAIAATGLVATGGTLAIAGAVLASGAAGGGLLHCFQGSRKADFEKHIKAALKKVKNDTILTALVSGENSSDVEEAFSFINSALSKTNTGYDDFAKWNLDPEQVSVEITARLCSLSDTVANSEFCQNLAKATLKAAFKAVFTNRDFWNNSEIYIHRQILDRTQTLVDSQEELLNEQSKNRSWKHILDQPILSVHFLLILKADVGTNWVDENLKKIGISCQSDKKPFYLDAILQKAPKPNTVEETAKNLERPIFSYYETYDKELGYWVSRISKKAMPLTKVAGFEAHVPWSMTSQERIKKVADFGSIRNFSMILPPKLYQAGIEEFEITFRGDIFSFTIALSDHALDGLHDFASQTHQLGGKSGFDSVGTSFSGQQLLDMFYKQGGVNAKKVGRRGAFQGQTGPNGNTINFFPEMPIGFQKTDESKIYSFSVTVPEKSPDFSPARIKEIDEQLLQSPKDAQLYVDKAAIYAVQGQFFESIRTLDESLKNTDPTMEIHGLMGEVLSKLDRHEEALHHFLLAEKFNTSDARIQNDIAICLYNTGKHEQAVKRHAKAIQLEPKNGTWLTNFGSTHMYMENYDEAIKCLHRASEIKPDDDDIFVRLGMAYLFKDKFDDGLKCFQNAARISPDNIENHKLVASCLSDMKRYSEAVESIRCALKINETADLYFTLGEYKNELKLWKDTEDAFRKAIKLGSDEPDIKVYLAIAVSNQKRPKEGLEILEELLKFEPNHKLANEIYLQIESFRMK